MDVVMPHVCIRRSHRVLGGECYHARVNAHQESRGTEAGASRRGFRGTAKH